MTEHGNGHVDQTCLVCGRDFTHEDIRGACYRCEQRMARELRELPELYVQAHLELQPGSGTGVRGTERSLGVRIAALDLIEASDLISTLATWETAWRDEFGLADPKPRPRRPTRALTDVTGFLTTWLHKACTEYEGIDVFAVELHKHHAAARQAARQTSRRTWTVHCPTDIVPEVGEVTRCATPLRVTDDPRDRVHCRGCGRLWDVGHLVAVASSDSEVDVWVDTETICGWYEVSRATLKRWAAAGQVRRERGKYELRSVATRMAQRRAGTA